MWYWGKKFLFIQKWSLTHSVIHSIVFQFFFNFSFYSSLTILLIPRSKVDGRTLDADQKISIFWGANYRVLQTGFFPHHTKPFSRIPALSSLFFVHPWRTVESSSTHWAIWELLEEMSKRNCFVRKMKWACLSGPMRKSRKWVEHEEGFMFFVCKFVFLGCKGNVLHLKIK